MVRQFILYFLLNLLPYFSYSQIEKDSQLLNNRVYTIDTINTVKLLRFIDFDCPTLIDSNTYNSKSNYEKFIHALHYPEECNYSCSRILDLKNDSTRYLNSNLAQFNQSYWSKRQLEFINKNRDSIQFYLSKELKSKFSSPHLYLFIHKFKFKIPLKEVLDNYYLTNNTKAISLLCRYMKDDKYQPFIQSRLYKKLYPKNEYQTIVFDKKTEEMALSLINKYLKSHKYP